MHIQKNIDLFPYNTFHLHCLARYFVEIHNIQDLQELISHDVFLGSSHLILGGGSNILLTTPTFEGLVIKNNILGKKIIQQTTRDIHIQVGAGENWNSFVLWSIEQGYTGIENLISIPGNMGAAPMQNIGAYGVEIADSITEVTYVDFSTGKVHTLSNTACAFGYRDSIFKQTLKNKVCITHVTLCLQKYTPEIYTPNISYGAIKKKLEMLKHKDITPAVVATIIADIRAEKLPDRTRIGTAGSFFKNPIVTQEKYLNLQKQHPQIVGHPHQDNIKLSAGQLIDLSGLKGITKDAVGTYKNHALVLVHHGGGTGKDIVDISAYIQQKVYTTFGIHIEPEVNFI